MESIVPILRKGEFPHHRGFVQVVDDEAIRAVLAQDIPAEGLLFDFDHYSDLSNAERETLAATGILLPSDASGWIHGLELSEDGSAVLAKVEWTDAGEKAVKSGAYKYTSPVFPAADLERLGGNRVRPHRISKVALTNEPNMRTIGAILANREGADDGESDGGVDYDLALSMDTESNEENKMELMKLIEALGLPEDADEAAVLAAIDEMKKKLADAESAKEQTAAKEAELENRVAALEAEKAKAEEDAFVSAELAKYPSIPNREAAEAALRANRETGAALLASLKDALESKPAVVAAQTPEAALENRAEEENKVELTGVARLAAALKK